MIKELTRALNDQPTTLFFTITSRCNAFCDFCWNWKNVADAGKFSKPGQPIKRPELSLEEISQMTKQLSSMLTVNLFGGEPFLREDIFEIISLFVNNSDTKYISIPTNGSWPDKIKEVIGRAVKDFPDTFFKIYLSLDGPETEHNKIRKLKDGYNRLISSMNYLYELKSEHKNISVSCNINFNAQTQHYMKSFVREVMSWNKFDSISLDLVRGNDLYDKELLKTDTMLYNELESEIKNYRPISSQPFSPLHKAIEQKTNEVILKSIQNPERRVFNCFAGKKIILLNDIGDVMACEHLLDRKMGNIRNFDYNIYNLLQSAEAKEIRKDIIDRKCNCRWDCAINNSNIVQFIKYPDLILKAVKNMTSSL